MAKIAVHFGGGALGRGMVVPVLKNSGYTIVLVDTDKDLIHQLQKDNHYNLHLTDHKENTNQTIALHRILSPIEEKEELKYWIDQAEVISTSVRRENLNKAASILVEEADSLQNKTILCAENIEHVSDVFSSELEQAASRKNIELPLDQMNIPDTMVDRICASAWPDSTQIDTETFYEFVMSENSCQIDGIQKVNNIEAAFMRKRLLLNTYADISSFFAYAKNLTYLHEGISDPSIQTLIAPFVDLTHNVLAYQWQFDRQELEAFQLLYSKRLKNSGLNRRLESVARNLWDKLGEEERFAGPLIQALDLNISIDEAIRTLIKMIQMYTNESNQIIKEKLQKLWGSSLKGEELYKAASRYV